MDLYRRHTRKKVRLTLFPSRILFQRWDHRVPPAHRYRCRSTVLHRQGNDTSILSGRFVFGGLVPNFFGQIICGDLSLFCLQKVRSAWRQSQISFFLPLAIQIVVSDSSWMLKIAPPQITMVFWSAWIFFIHWCRHLRCWNAISQTENTTLRL